MKILYTFTFVTAALFSTQNCGENTSKQAPKISETTAKVAKSIPLPDGFNAYWYAGKAELSTYEVTQERYGEIRAAEQVNIFVTEDFSKSKQVKLDNPSASPADRVPVLKLNSIRRFHTGIYDYSIMQSVFTPVSGEPTLKTTTTVQDWCGHVFMQSNLQDNGYRVQGFSYFESEGDTDEQWSLALQEDELFTRIRLNPDAIPIGKVSLLPSMVFTRLRHQPGKAQMADIQLNKGATESTLSVLYQDTQRSLSIRFETAFPYRILGWEELIGGKLASKGILKATRLSPYWSEHDSVHAPLRDSIQLKF